MAAGFVVKRFKGVGGGAEHSIRVKDYGAQNGGCLVECESHDKCDLPLIIGVGVRAIIEAEQRGLVLAEIYLCRVEGSTAAKVSRTK